MATDVLQQAADAIKQRLAELEEEKMRLERAVGAISGERRGPGRPRGSTNNASKVRRSQGGGSRRAKRGQREKQLLRSIRSNPSYKPADHAREIGIAPNQVYGLVAKLTEAGKVRKSDAGLLEAV